VLSVGQSYYAVFYTRPGFNPDPGFHINIATNKLGMHFSTVPNSSMNPITIDNSAQVYADSVISDSSSWTQVYGFFIADSAYEYLSIGNFFTDSATTHISLDTSAALAYYYIDDILVVDSLSIGINENNSSASIDVFPNPFEGELNIEMKNNLNSEVILYDITSRKILQQKFTNSITLSIEPLAKGIYIYEVRNRNGVIKKGKVVKD
jgi:hypothetical protein